MYRFDFFNSLMAFCFIRIKRPGLEVQRAPEQKLTSVQEPFILCWCALAAKYFYIYWKKYEVQARTSKGKLKLSAIVFSSMI